MWWRASANEEPVAFHELPERVSDRVPGPADPDRLHHAGVAQLATAQLTVEDLREDGKVVGVRDAAMAGSMRGLVEKRRHAGRLSERRETTVVSQVCCGRQSQTSTCPLNA